MQPRFEKLPKQREYLASKPFPFCEVRGFLSKSDVKRINREWPDQADMVHHNKVTSNKYSSRSVPPAAQSLSDIMYSRATCKIFSKVSGIPDLIADPENRGGGLHQINRGGFLQMHVDFNRKNTKEGFIYRRVNVLIYLNIEWQEDWGGELILTDREHYVTSILPKCGTLAMFNTSEESWHGHPYPLNTPEHIQRRSIAFYYYSKIPSSDFTEEHSTIYIEG